MKILDSVMLMERLSALLQNKHWPVNPKEMTVDLSRVIRSKIAASQSFGFVHGGLAMIAGLTGEPADVQDKQTFRSHCALVCACVHRGTPCEGKQA